MNDFMGTLKGKIGPLPVWVWAVIGTAGLTLFLMRSKGQSGNDKAAASATNTDLGTASSLADLFTVAGIMPYSGGDVYVTQTVNNPATPTTPGGGLTKPQPITKPPAPPVSKPAPVTKPPVTTVKKPAPPSVAKPLQVKINTKDSVKWNDTEGGIAAHYGLTADQLFNYNISTGSKGANRPASTIATLKKRGKNLVYNGTTFYVPKKGSVYSGGY